jgi:hypothetical protein
MEKQLHEAKLSGTRSNPAVNEIHPGLKYTEKHERKCGLPQQGRPFSFVMQSTRIANGQAHQMDTLVRRLAYGY